MRLARAKQRVPPQCSPFAGIPGYAARRCALNARSSIVRRGLQLTAGCCLLLMTASCAGSGESGQSEAPSPSERQVSRAEFGEAWPFTVDEGYVDCLPAQAAVFKANGTTYAINGLARSRYPAVDPIWRDNPEIPGTKVSIGSMIDLALEQCK